MSGQHCVNSSRHTVASIRRRLVLERHLPDGVQPTPENMLRYYGELPPAAPRPNVTYTINVGAPTDAYIREQRAASEHLWRSFR